MPISTRSTKREEDARPTSNVEWKRKRADVRVGVSVQEKEFRQDNRIRRDHSGFFRHSREGGNPILSGFFIQFFERIP
ncbi:MAG: hypothetical protein CVU57_23185 [Deltaproteobacteria bacterium HGW-Deltaproteobacteria-15]|jgi:hypothetical protein|nr:MAG: hypothetical protein CVU57_23185 [Deltaproteobacteria bacterium HGW-Deltaproteobacteria-15]